MTAWLAGTFVTTTLLLLLVLALRTPVARTFGAGWAYALWAVPTARLVLPPFAQLTPDIQLPAAAALIPAAAVGGTAPLPAIAGPGQWLPLILAVWAGGAVLFLAFQWMSYRAFSRRVESSARPARPPEQGGIEALVSDAVDGPLAMGLLHPRIVLPADFEGRYSETERRLALAHEVTHHRRGDIWWNLAATLVLAFNWFNPVAWFAFRAFRADQELSCDAAVAAEASEDERFDYARALVKSASRPGLIAACALNGASQLKGRLRMLRLHRVSAGRRAGGSIALSALALTAFTIGSPRSAAVAEEAPELIAVTGVARTILPRVVAVQRGAAPEVETEVKAAAVARPAVRARSAAGRPAKAAKAAQPEMLAAAPSAATEAAPSPPLPPPAMRMVRVERQEFFSSTPGEGGARILIIRTSLSPERALTPELARALKAARASGTQTAQTGEIVRRLQIRLNGPIEGE
jgi:beta-lactamase regulating signal transducer with metallopeptidase domain